MSFGARCLHGQGSEIRAMAEPVIPTMACPTCSHHAHPEACSGCMGTGIVQCLPLTPEQVAALPDGARVVATCANPECPQCGGAGGRPFAAPAGDVRVRPVRVWLAEDAEP